MLRKREGKKRAGEGIGVFYTPGSHHALSWEVGSFTVLAVMLKFEAGAKNA